jgi:hypothetical protein
MLAEVNEDKLAELIPKQQAELTNLADKATHQEEVCNALNFMGCDKAPGVINERPVEVKKYAVTSQIVVAICAAFNKALEDGHVPALSRDVIIAILFKKGDRRDCSYYRGISLITYVGKTIKRLIQNRLFPFAESLGWYSESQHGFPLAVQLSMPYLYHGSCRLLAQRSGKRCINAS